MKSTWGVAHGMSINRKPEKNNYANKQGRANGSLDIRFEKQSLLIHDGNGETDDDL